MRVRDISGHVLYVIRTPLKGSSVRVPSLGVVADKYVDGATYLPSTILQIHSSALEARKEGEGAEVYFVDAMKARGMSHMEATFIWDIMDLQEGEVIYRQQIPLGFE